MASTLNRSWFYILLGATLLGSVPSCTDEDDAPTPAGGQAGSAPATGGAASGGTNPTGGTNPAGGSADAAGANHTEGGSAPGGAATAGAGAGSYSGAGGAASGEGGVAGDAGAPGPSGDFPELLSETGLYEDIAEDRIAAAALAYRPAYELWSDGAEKRRWVMLPEGAPIDTSEMDYWRYPVGTRFFKEFSVDGRPVETRLLQKTERKWVAVAYVWNEEASEAIAAPQGERGVLGTEHDVPEQADCKTCHNEMQDFVLGFSALQLSHDQGGVNLASLIEGERLSAPPAAPFTIPGDAAARGALGYLHANCGTCHNDRSSVMSRTPISMWLGVESLSAVEDTPTYKTTVDRRPGLEGEHELLIAPGAPEASEIVARMKQRGSEDQMPPIASNKLDSEGIALIESWIATLPE